MAGENLQELKGKLKLLSLGSIVLTGNNRNVLIARRHSPDTSSSKIYHCVAIVTLILIKYTALETLVCP